MKIIEQLQVSDEAFFTEITRSIIADIQKMTNKHVHASQLKTGLTYRKTLPNRSHMNNEVTVRILNCIPNQLYQSSFCSSIDRTIVTYRIQKIDEQKIDVTYEEEYKLIKGSHKRRLQFIQKSYQKKKSEKAGRQLLKHIESYIKKQQAQEM